RRRDTARTAAGGRTSAGWSLRLFASGLLVQPWWTQCELLPTAALLVFLAAAARAGLVPADLYHPRGGHRVERRRTQPIQVLLHAERGQLCLVRRVNAGSFGAHDE